MRTIVEEDSIIYTRFHKRLLTHPNPLKKDLYIRTLPGNPNRRLKRNWCRDLLQNFNQNYNKFVKICFLALNFNPDYYG